MMTMQTVVIRDVIGTNGITRDQGQKVYDLIHPVLKSGVNITLDFTGVGPTTAVFLNTAIGQLLRDVPLETVYKHLMVASISRGKRMAVTTVITNSNRYYHDEQYRNAIDMVIQKAATDGV
jgi:hypothetical protein